MLVSKKRSKSGKRKKMKKKESSSGGNKGTPRRGSINFYFAKKEKKEKKKVKKKKVKKKKVKKKKRKREDIDETRNSIDRVKEPPIKKRKLVDRALSIPRRNGVTPSSTPSGLIGSENSPVNSIEMPLPETRSPPENQHPLFRSPLQPIPESSSRISNSEFHTLQRSSEEEHTPSNKSSKHIVIPPPPIVTSFPKRQSPEPLPASDEEEHASTPPTGQELETNIIPPPPTSNHEANKEKLIEIDEESDDKEDEDENDLDYSEEEEDDDDDFDLELSDDEHDLFTDLCPTTKKRKKRNRRRSNPNSIDISDMLAFDPELDDLLGDSGLKEKNKKLAQQSKRAINKENRIKSLNREQKEIEKASKRKDRDRKRKMREMEGGHQANMFRRANGNATPITPEDGVNLEDISKSQEILIQTENTVQRLSENISHSPNDIFSYIPYKCLENPVSRSRLIITQKGWDDPKHRELWNTIQGNDAESIRLCRGRRYRRRTKDGPQKFPEERLRKDFGKLFRGLAYHESSDLVDSCFDILCCAAEKKIYVPKMSHFFRIFETFNLSVALKRARGSISEVPEEEEEEDSDDEIDRTDSFSFVNIRPRDTPKDKEYTQNDLEARFQVSMKNFSSLVNYLRLLIDRRALTGFLITPTEIVDLFFIIFSFLSDRRTVPFSTSSHNLLSLLISSFPTSLTNLSIDDFENHLGVPLVFENNHSGDFEYSYIVRSICENFQGNSDIRRLKVNLLKDLLIRVLTRTKIENDFSEQMKKERNKNNNNNNNNEEFFPHSAKCLKDFRDHIAIASRKIVDRNVVYMMEERTLISFCLNRFLGLLKDAWDENMRVDSNHKLIMDNFRNLYWCLRHWGDWVFQNDDVRIFQGIDNVVGNPDKLSNNNNNNNKKVEKKIMTDGENIVFDQIFVKKVSEKLSELEILVGKFNQVLLVMNVKVMVILVSDIWKEHCRNSRILYQRNSENYQIWRKNMKKKKKKKRKQSTLSSFVKNKEESDDDDESSDDESGSSSSDDEESGMEEESQNKMVDE